MENIKIDHLDEQAMVNAQLHIDQLTNPVGSLGKIEELAIQLAGVTRNAKPNLQKPAIIVFAADHGITAEGISAFPQEVTIQMVANMANGGAAINAFANNIGANFKVVDVGVNTDQPMHGAVDRKVMHGTKNYAKGNAMTLKEVEQALQVGYEETKMMIEEGADSICFGEVGIGNTTVSSTLFAAISNLPVTHITGYGTGISDEQLLHKIEVIENALQLHANEPLVGKSLLVHLGGLEIAAMAGGMIAAAQHHTPILLDGLISTVSACIAEQIVSGVKSYLFATHKSVEPGHVYALNYLQLTPLIDLEFRLGEGTGAAIAYPLFSAACHMMNDMATFADAGVSGKS